MKESDRLFLSAAIELAKKGLMTVAPNPPVGCLILKNGCIIGRGFHQQAGKEHAEINALSSVTESPEGATVYVSLEPCAHQGKRHHVLERLLMQESGESLLAIWTQILSYQGRELPC